MEIDIKIPELKIDSKEQELRIRKLFSDDKEKSDGFLSLIPIFVKKNEPISITDLKDLLQNYFKREIDRVVVYRQSDRLVKLGLLNRVSSGNILMMDESDKSDIHRHIEAKHRKFLNGISMQFRTNYGNKNYLWVSNSDGEKYIEWCCKINGFSYKIK